jgi:hypothetical protein
MTGPSLSRPRGTRPDAVIGDKLLVIKNVQFLRLTYQIRLLAYVAQKEKKTVVLLVPARCQFHPALEQFMKQLQGVLVREDL